MPDAPAEAQDNGAGVFLPGTNNTTGDEMPEEDKKAFQNAFQNAFKKEFQQTPVENTAVEETAACAGGLSDVQMFGAGLYWSQHREAGRR